MNRLAGKVALISGGARGQGEAEVRLFVEEGAKVVFGDVLDDLGEAVAKDLNGEAIYTHLDVRKEDEWKQAVALAESQFGALDILVNNAGILSMGVLTHDTALEDYMRVIEVNQVGVFLGMKAALPAMLKKRKGAIVNISSTNGMTGYGGTAAYTASKFAVRGMTKNAALEYGHAGIRVNSIHPGGIDTPMTRPENIGGITAEDQDALYDGVPIQRPGQPREIANLALFLASDEASFCTGAEYLADGGMLAGVVNPYCKA